MSPHQSGRFFSFLDKGEVGIGKYGAEALLTTDAGGPKNNELAFKSRVNFLN